MKKFAVVANCQARALAAVLEVLLPKWKSIGSVITHLSSSKTEEQDLDIINSADIVFAQYVSDEYKADHLTTRNLKAHIGGRLVVWPNIFFSGQTPDSAYLTLQDGTRVPSPMLHYHSVHVYHCWKRGCSLSECVSKAQDLSCDPSSWINAIEDSLRKLRLREEFCDVVVSDFVEARWRAERLFHIFNHPNSRMIIECASRCVSSIGETCEEVPTASIFGEPLGQFQPPTLPAHARALGFAFPTTLLALGVSIEFDGNSLPIFTKQKKIWRFDEFVSASYRCYDAFADRMRLVRITP